jgi:hypothetical protein
LADNQPPKGHHASHETGGSDVVSVAPASVKCGVGSRATTTANGTVNYAHGLGRTPIFVRITALWGPGSVVFAQSNGAYDGTNTKCVWASGQYNNHLDCGNNSTYIVLIYCNPNQDEYSRATITVDATNIMLAWTKSASPSGTLYFEWECW